VMLRRVAPVRTDVSEEPSASFIRVIRIGELGTTLTATSNRRTVFLRSVRRLIVAASVVPLKNGVFWDVTLCGSCKNRRFGGTWRLLHQGDKNR
jgi:hypothetical protein